MSATIIIRPEGASGRKLTLRDVLPEELSYGISDEYGRLDEGKEGEYTLLFDPENIGRGFQIRFDGTTTEFRLNYPNSRHDIELCYMMVEQVRRMQGADSFEYEGETVTPDRVEQMISRDVEATVQALKLCAEKINSGETRSLTIYGVVNPLDIWQKELEIFGCDIDRFGEWLNERQQMDVYYAVPHFYEKPDGSVFGAFALKAGVTSVVPLSPAPSQRMKDKISVSQWIVMFGFSDDREPEGFPAIEYGGLTQYIQKGGYYDAGHAIVKLTDSDVETLLTQQRADI